MSSAQRKTELDGLAVAMLIACCAFWGFQQTLIKSTLGEVPPLWQATLRFVGATLLLMAWCKWRGIALWQAGDVGRGVFKAGVLAGVLFGFEFLGIYLGLRDTSASRLTVFLYTSPFVVALLLPRFVATEALRKLQWLGLGVAFVGVAVAFAEGFMPGAAARLGVNHLRGDALALFAGLMWGLTTIVIRSTVLSKESAEKALFYQLWVTALFMPMGSWAVGEQWSLNYSAWAWFSLAVQTVIGAFASYFAWMWMLQRYPANQMGSFVFLTPMFALAFGTIWLKEPLTVQLGIGVLAVAVGIWLVNRK
jgi:drug/metabolite transporter (DMT)-like permease